MKKEQYYSNKGNCSTHIPSRNDEFLNIKNHLSEFTSQEDKDDVIENLGIDQKLQELRELINNKVLEASGVAWDLYPTEGNTDKVLSSDAIYKTLLNYISEGQLQGEIQKLWKRIIDKTNEVGEALLEEVNGVKEEQDQRIDQYEDKMKELDVLIHSLAKSSGGAALSNHFGDSEYIGINQKTLTNAINKIWDKIEEITGESGQGISMVVTPTYFISEGDCTVDIVATAINTNNGIFEKVSFYGNDELLAEAENVDYYTAQATISGDTEIKCVARILGREYTEIRRVKHYNSFWILTGNYDSSELESHMTKENLTPIPNGMRGNYDIIFNQNNYLYIIMSGQLAQQFIRADLNGIEIPFETTSILINGNRYIIYKSVNTFNEGTYNIDING